MARNIEEILGREIKSLKDLRAAIKEYQESLIGVDAESQEFKDTCELLSAAQNELTKVTRAGKDAYGAATDSIVGMEREYKNLYNQYKLLSEEQRNSDFGKSMAESLNGLSEKLNETKKGVGNFKDNIGRYANDIMSAFSTMASSMGGSVGGLVGPFANATKGVLGFNAAMKANPIGAIVGLVMAFVNVLKSLKDSISSSEESQQRWNIAMSAFQPMIDAVQNGLTRMGEAIVSIVEKIASLVEKFRIAKAAFTDFIGLTEGAEEAVKGEIQSYKDLATAVEDADDAKREARKQNAVDKAEVERLREEASETTNLAEQRELLTAARDKQAEIDQRNLEMAQEELRILEEQAEKTANDAAANDALADAFIRVQEAQATAASNARNFNRQLNSIGKSAKSAASGLKNYKEEAKKVYEQSLDSQKTELQKVTEKYEQERKLLIKYGYDVTALTKEYNTKVAQINKTARTTEVEMQKKHIKELSDFDTWYREALTKKFGENSQEVLQFDRKSLQERLNDINNLMKNGADKFNEAISGYSEAAKKGIGNEAINALKNFDTYLQGVIEQINERWEGLDLVPPPSLNVTENATGEQLSQAVKNWYDSVVIFLDSLKTEANEVNMLNIAVTNTTREFEENAKRQAIDYGRFVEDLKNLDIANADEYNETISRINRRRLEEDEAYYSQFIADEKARLAENIAAVKESFGSRIAEEQDDTQREQLEQEKNAMIQRLTEESFARRLEAEQAFYDAKAQMRDMDLEAEMLSAQRTEEVWKNAFASFDQTTSSINSMISTYSKLMQTEIQSGKITEKEAEKKKDKLEDLAAVQLAVSVASITASTASSIMDVWKGYSAELKLNAETAAATGPAAAVTKAALDAKSLASAIIKTTGLGATAAAQLAAARGGYISTVSSLQEDSGSAAASVAAPAEMDSNPYTYTRTLQTAEEEDEINRPIWVSVQDINAVQERVRVSDQESRF